MALPELVSPFFCLPRKLMAARFSWGPEPPPVAYRIVVDAARARRTNGAHNPERAAPPVVTPATNVRRVRATCLPVMGFSIWSVRNRLKISYRMQDEGERMTI